MGFQTSVALVQGAGIPGEFYDDSPHRSQPYILNSGTAANNVFGSAFSVNAEGIANSGNTGSQIYAGILCNPKGSALYGSALTPSLVLPNGAVGEMVTFGSIWVNLPAACNIGDWVIFNNTTGALSTVAPGAAPGVGNSLAYAAVDFFTPAGAGLAVITLSGIPGAF